jgi:hypothetical protein
MQAINNNKRLADAITALQNQQYSELNLLKSHLDYTLDSLNPINIIKEKFSFFDKSPLQKSEVIKEIITMGTNLIGSRLLFGGRLNPLNKILPTLIQKSADAILTKVPEITAFSSKKFLKNLLTKMKIKE